MDTLADLVFPLLGDRTFASESHRWGSSGVVCGVVVCLISEGDNPARVKYNNVWVTVLVPSGMRQKFIRNFWLDEIRDRESRTALVVNTYTLCHSLNLLSYI